MIPIKDEGFLAFLQTKKFRSALRNEAGKADRNGSYLDTNASAVLNKTSLNIRDQYHIVDLTGLEYFIHVVSLTISLYSLEVFPILPPQLKSLHLNNLKIKELPPLPDNIQELSINWNSRLLSLPKHLLHFNCFNADLSQLPALPLSLKELHCTHNQLTQLPDLPDGLITLDCSYNNIKALPRLPPALKNLTCSDNQLTTLPTFPSSIEMLDCSDNKITVIEKLPKTIKSFISCRNQLAIIPLVPKGTFINTEGNRPPSISSYFAGKETDNFNLKLVLIEALSIQDTSFEQALIQASKEGDLELYLRGILLTKKQLNSITQLSIDGGNSIYSLLNPLWDGEDDLYELTSINGIEELHNLEAIEVIAMVDPLVEEELHRRNLIQ
ncbi:MAG: DUF6892 domain-containing protein [Aureispira sp.]